MLKSDRRRWLHWWWHWRWRRVATIGIGWCRLSALRRCVASLRRGRGGWGWRLRWHTLIAGRLAYQALVTGLVAIADSALASRSRGWSRSRGRGWGRRRRRDRSGGRLSRRRRRRRRRNCARLGTRAGLGSHHKYNRGEHCDKSSHTACVVDKRGSRQRVFPSGTAATLLGGIPKKSLHYALAHMMVTSTAAATLKHQAKSRTKAVGTGGRKAARSALWAVRIGDAWMLRCHDDVRIDISLRRRMLRRPRRPSNHREHLDHWLLLPQAIHRSRASRSRLRERLRATH